MSFLHRTRSSSSTLIAAALAVSCTLGDDEDDHPPICEDCTNPAPEAALPTGVAGQSDSDPRTTGGFVNSSNGGSAGLGGLGGNPFGPVTGGRSGPFQSGGSSATGAGPGTGGTSSFGGASSAFAGNAAFGGT